MVYSEVHLTLLTYIRSVGIAKETKLLHAYETIASRLVADLQIDQNAFADVINQINTKIESTGFKIARYRPQNDDEILYIFVNSQSDELVRSNTTYSAPELDALKHIIDDIVQQPGFQFLVGEVNAGQQVCSLLSRTVREGSDLLAQFVDDGWLEIIGSRYILLPRTICELKHYLIERYGLVEQDQSGHIFLCFQCKDIVTHGIKCERCFTSFHQKCVYIYRKQSSDCPGCQKFLLTEKVGLELVLS